MTQQLVGAALDQLETAMQLGEHILQAPAEHIVRFHKEMQAHGAVTNQGIGGALRTLDAGPLVTNQGKELKAADLQVPTGYRAEIVATGLSFASAVATAEDGTVYVAESGFSYPGVEAPPRVLRVRPNGGTEVVAQGLEGPVVGLAVHQGKLYVSNRGKITAVDLSSGAMTDIITGLPSLGDHFNENIAVGPDNKLYISQGTATNSGVVGLDNYVVYWLRQHPQFSDVPCRDYTLNGRNYTTGNPLTEDVTDMATTGPFMPFGKAVEPGQIVKGQTKCNGAVLRANLDGSALEVFADGFRNPYGLAFHPDGRLFVTENGPDDRGSRPVNGPDNFYEVVQGGWYGWPDFYSFIPVEDPRLKPTTSPVSQPVLLNPPPLAKAPLARFEPHSSSNGFDFTKSAAFAPVGTAFVAQFGDLTPPTAGGARLEAGGHQVAMVTPQGEVQPFLTSSARSSDGHGLLRATDATFDSSGQVLYVTHFGEFSTARGVLAPTVKTGALIRITRMAAQKPGQPGQLPTTGEAAAPSMTFPETGYSISEQFLRYWQANGGLPVFGYPIASEQPANGQISQWFERNRLELHPANSAPYNVQLGRLGAEALERQGIDWQTLLKAAPTAAHYFSETGHAIAPEFWDYWTSHGLEFGDRGVSEREALALFGYPISEARLETNSSGDTVLTQWFERARFEYHPDNPAPYKVLLGRLGAELAVGRKQ